jgi:hypothetical protein
VDSVGDGFSDKLSKAAMNSFSSSEGSESEGISGVFGVEVGMKKDTVGEGQVLGVSGGELTGVELVDSIEPVLPSECTVQ